MPDDQTTPAKKKSILAALAPFGLMAPIVAILAFLLFGYGPSTADNGNDNAAIQAAIDSATRSGESRERDGGRKPAEVLKFFGIKPGMTVLEVGAGTGYYAEIVSAAVGPAGKVIAQNSPTEFYLNTIQAIFEPMAEQLANVEPHVAPLENLKVADNSVDVAMIVLIYHHMHYTEAEGEKLPISTQGHLKVLLKALKPGGVLGIIEHAAPDGTNRADSAALHRVDEATTVADITGAGFTLAAKSDLLQVASDDRTVYWFRTVHMGKTWRILHKYVKPE
jgi:predicted methyltransferase